MGVVVEHYCRRTNSILLFRTDPVHLDDEAIIYLRKVGSPRIVAVSIEIKSSLTGRLFLLDQMIIITYFDNSFEKEQATSEKHEIMILSSSAENLIVDSTAVMAVQKPYELMKMQ